MQFPALPHAALEQGFTDAQPFRFADKNFQIDVQTDSDVRITVVDHFEILLGG